MGRLHPAELAYRNVLFVAADSPMVALTYGGHPLARSTSSSASNGVNIVAAILVTASSMMVLLALRIWLCRCTISPGSSITATADESTDAKKEVQSGLGKDVIDKFAMVDYKGLSRTGANGYDKLCTVCLCEFNTKDLQIRLLPGCNHSFHPPCIEMWLFSHTSCPICRKSLLPPPTAQGGATSLAQPQPEQPEGARV